MLLQDLENPEQMYRALGCKMVVGMPFKDQATSDTLYMTQIPPSSDKNGRRALKRLQVLQQITCSRIPSHIFFNESVCDHSHAHIYILSLAHSPTHPLTHSLTCSPTHPLTASLTHTHSCWS